MKKIAVFSVVIVMLCISASKVSAQTQYSTFDLWLYGNEKIQIGKYQIQFADLSSKETYAFVVVYKDGKFLSNNWLELNKPLEAETLKITFIEGFQRPILVARFKIETSGFKKETLIQLPTFSFEISNIENNVTIFYFHKNNESFFKRVNLREPIFIGGYRIEPINISEESVFIHAIKSLVVFDGEMRRGTIVNLSEYQLKILDALANESKVGFGICRENFVIKHLYLSKNDLVDFKLYKIKVTGEPFIGVVETKLPIKVFVFNASKLSIPVFPELGIIKKVNRSIVEVDDSVTVTVTFKNFGPIPAKNVRVFEIMPPNFVLTTGKTYWDGNLDVNQSVTYRYSLTALKVGDYELPPTRAIFSDEKGQYETSSGSITGYVKKKELLPSLAKWFRDIFKKIAELFSR
ncbi:MAG: DUF11 domain-containing protein [Euryarchaeota archaeon]|nr:DUF11 domain-containing protein [Euryarchaeota archaeon]